MPAAEIIKPKIAIKVVGVGGGGNNIVRCVREKYDLDITLIGLNSDLRQLKTLYKQGITVLHGRQGRDRRAGGACGGEGDSQAARGRGSRHHYGDDGRRIWHGSCACCCRDRP